MCLGNAFVKRLFGHVHQLLSQNATTPDGNGPRRIPNETTIFNSDIEADDITKTQHASAANSMDHLVINRDANLSRKITILVEGATSPVMLHPPKGEVIDFLRRDAGLNEAGNLIENHTGDRASR